VINKLVNTILYADDQILMATSEDDLQTVAHHLNLIARKYKMTISSTETKSMTMCGEPHTEGKNCDKRQYYWTGNR
jgi:beta-xylosidase